MSDLVQTNSYHNNHQLTWLGAYLDGEINETLRGQIEAHLATCPDCRRELEELRQLSTLLQASPVPLSPQSDADFANAVMARVTRPVPSLWQRGLAAGWRHTPLFLFAGWAFFQALQWVSTALLIGLRLIPGGRALLPSGGTPQESFLLEMLRMSLPGNLTGQTIEGLSWLAPFNALALLNLVVLVVLALLFLSWLASWWAYHHSRATSQS